MLRFERNVFPGMAVTACFLLSVFALLAISGASWKSLQAQEAEVAEPAPPAGQTYVGSKRCASCHFEQFMVWRKTKHSTAFKGLTEKYQSDKKCLKCHTTGYGEESGFTDVDSTPALKGVTCESCHGPGSKHEEVAKPFAQTKKLTPEQEKAVRDSIWRMLPKNICVECHKVQAHGESDTPSDMKKD